MAVAISSLTRDVTGSKRVHRGVITFDSSYPTGGEDLAVASLGLSVLDHISFMPVPLQVSSNHVALQHTYDYTNKKILAYEQGFRTGSTSATTSANGALVETIAAAESAFRAYGTAVDTNYNYGGLRECGTQQISLRTRVALRQSVGKQTSGGSSEPPF